jgi:hypothetical protein
MRSYKTLSMPLDIIAQLDEVKRELEKKFGVKFSYPQVVTYLVKHRSI